MIQVNTKDFGQIAVEKDAVYDFPQGIYGFEEDRHFAVFSRTVEDLDFLYLQSMDHPVPCFLVFEPWELYPQYQPEVSKEDLTACGAATVDDLILLVIATIPSSLEDLSLNMKSPIALNPKTKQGRQVILQNAAYPVRYLPFQPDKEGGHSC